jgi:hypothetical protein
LGGLYDRNGIIAVHTNGIDTVGGSTHGDTIASILILNASGNGIFIIPADKERLRFKCSCEVKRGMKVAFRGGAFSEISHRNAILIFKTEGIPCACGLRHLSG